MLEWFTTIPGILVICGVILLVIAIILFAVSAKKDKKENMTVESVNNNIELVSQVATPEVQPITGVATTPVQEPILNNAVSEPVVEPVVEIVVEPVVNNVQPVVEEPVISEVVSIPTEQEVVNYPTMEEVKLEVNEPAMIYGGQEPVINFSVEEKPVTIYGGNDPLEATQKLPTVEEYHAPYGGEYPEIKVDVPVVEATIEPVQDVVTPMSTVDINPVSQPEVINIPDIPEVTEEPVVMPEIKPVVEPTVEPALEEVKTPVVEEL